MATVTSSKCPTVPFGSDTTYRPKPSAGDYLLWIRCTNIFSSPAKFEIVDFWEFKENDFLLITSREEDYPAPAKDMEENPSPFLWKVVAGDRLALVGHREIAGQRKRVLFFIMECEERGYVYAEPAEKTYAAFMSFGRPSSDSMTPEIRALWNLAFKAVCSLGIPRTCEAPIAER